MADKHIGIVGCSAEGAALCYRTICLEAAQSMGEHFHPEISMHTHCLGEYMIGIRSANWAAVADLMISSTLKLQAAGADVAICPDNTIHEAFPLVIKKTPIPWLHIAQVVAEKAGENGYKELGLLGTKYLMEGPVYPEVLKVSEIKCRIPEKPDRENIDRIIFSELVNGVFSEESRLYFNQVIQKLKNSGCDAVVLGCTEIPLLVREDDCPLPTLDSTRLLARAAIKYSLTD
jgi:aspartate racemase